VTYQLDVDPTPDGTRLGISTHAGPASFLADADRRGVWPTLAARARLPVQERRTGFTQVQKSQVLIAAPPTRSDLTVWPRVLRPATSA